jgi:hypothetical protein
VLAVYGFVPCLQPVTNFSRIYGALPPHGGAQPSLSLCCNHRTLWGSTAGCISGY